MANPDYQQEYIITEGELQAISNMNGSAKVIIETRNKVRSRPVPAAPVKRNQLARQYEILKNQDDWLRERT